MNPLIWLMRMARWSRNPPPMWKVRLVAGVIAVCLALVAVELFVGWPDWASVQPLRAPR